ncbi:hypothetical protein T440DRAFT_398410 [Plenodomus tracheiphilus IPT5]|uniref:Uncharacterized protein n=1 Tax=Plenodomus tracheiphilus IPT5 TaxID=1408161 RepID=A0A6A7B5N3_9PLEO|nr:hypothetical protein T440DRAFT_398410 [Plenodomus tracheiphilus IPT5]
MPAGDEDQIIADIAAVLAAGIDVDEDSDEDEEDDTSLDPDFVVEDDIVDESNLAVNDVVLEDVEVEPDFARKLRVILDTLCQWAGNISYPDFKALAKEDRPVTLSVWKVLKTVGVDFLLVMYLAAIPLRVQKLFLKQEWCLDDFLSLPEVEEEDASDQGLYGNFPTGRWERAPKIGCECYVGSAKVFQRRINDHLKISRQYDVSELPEGKNRSFHYRTTCREGVSCNFRKLAQFKRPIHAGYLVILEGIFMVLFGTYNYPGYCSQWATQPSYDLVKNLRASLDVPAIPWKGLNAAWPLRQGFVSQGGKAPSECCNAACKTMTYPRNMMPEGPKHPRAIADSWNPLGGYLCRRCESYRERRGVLPDNATLVKLVSQYTLEVTKSNSRLAGQTVICADCGAVEGSDGARNSANGYGTRHIATNGKIQCSACYGYVAKYGKKRDNTLSVSKAAREQADADRKAGRPVLCKHCLKAEGTCKKKHVASKSGGMICQQCYQKKHLR